MESMVRVGGQWLTLQEFRRRRDLQDRIGGVVFVGILFLTAFMMIWAFGDFSLMGVAG
jgi:hypothetical protein